MFREKPEINSGVGEMQRNEPINLPAKREPQYGTQSAADNVFQRHITAMPPCNLADDGQPQANPARLAATRRFQAIERFKNPL